MNEFSLPSSMKEGEKETLLTQLESLIEQTYNVEKEYIALTNSYNQLQALIKQIIEVLPNALWVLNEDGSIFLHNSEAERLDGLLELIDLASKEAEIPFKERFFLVKISTSESKRIVSATDITEQKRRERLASMGQMAAHLAHEIRNPIGSIALLVSSLSKRVVPKNRPIVDEIKRSLFRVERIIKSTLMYSKGVNPVISTIPLERIERECRAAVDSYSYTKPITFHYDFVPATLEADLNLLSLALQNFIFNAIDAVDQSDDESGDVWIRCVDDGEFLSFHIEDSGTPLEDSDRIFEAFYTTKTKGNGLGMALARQIVEAHKGEIVVQKEPKRFTIILPKREPST
ncbi:flagellar sensory histidine kinase FlgS [Hydrogenimonas sp.]|nr:flagellar sensory histidine kinase FlgS [Hydrogenimonas sp.]